MKQLHVTLDFNQRSYPITQLHWSQYTGELEMVRATTEYDRETSFDHYHFNVESISDDVIRLVGIHNTSFTATIFLK